MPHFLVAAAVFHDRSKTPFFIAAGVLVAWAVFVSGVGIRSARFPSSALQGRGLMAVSAVLVLFATSMAVVTAKTPPPNPHYNTGAIVNGVAPHRHAGQRRADQRAPPARRRPPGRARLQRQDARRRLEPRDDRLHQPITGCPQSHDREREGHGARLHADLQRRHQDADAQVCRRAATPSTARSRAMSRPA